jgi:uncharacterized protein YggT (Ycf19 family)
MVEEYIERPTETTEVARRESSTLYEPYDTNRPEVIDQHQTYHEKKAMVRSYNVIWFFVGLIDALLAFRFFFELLGANPYNAFVNLIYSISYPLAGPFRTIFGVTNAATATFDWSILVAIVVYLLIGYALIQLLRIIRPMTPEDVNHTIRTI